MLSATFFLSPQRIRSTFRWVISVDTFFWTLHSLDFCEEVVRIEIFNTLRKFLINERTVKRAIEKILEKILRE